MAQRGQWQGSEIRNAGFMTRESPPEGGVAVGAAAHAVEGAPFCMAIQEDEIPAGGKTAEQMGGAVSNGGATENAGVIILRAIDFVFAHGQCGISGEDAFAGRRLVGCVAKRGGVKGLSSISETDAGSKPKCEGVTGDTEAEAAILTD